MPPAGGDAEDGLQRAASAAGSEEFDDHASQDNDEEAAARKGEEVGERKKGFFGRFGFGKKKETKKADEEGFKPDGEHAGPNDDDEEQEPAPDSEDEDDDEEGGGKSGKTKATGNKAGSPRGSKEAGSPRGSKGSKGSKEEVKQGGKSKGIMGMFGIPSFLKFGKKPAEGEKEGGGSEDGSIPEEKGGLAERMKKSGAISPRSQAKAKAPPARTAVQAAVERSIFVKIGRVTRMVFTRDTAMQTGKEGSIELSRIAAANPFSLRALQQNVYTMQKRVAFLAMLGLLSGISVNEWCWLGYIPTPEEEMGYCSVAGNTTTPMQCKSVGGQWTDGLANPQFREGGQRCRSPDDPVTYLVGIVFKSICSALTGILLLAIFHLYECYAVELCFRNHLEYHRDFVDVPFWNMGLLPEFILEVLVCIMHPGPRLHWDISIEARGRLAIYTSESFLVAMMFVRMYTFWRYYREWMFMRYTSKNFASRLSDVAMDSKLAIKAILADMPFKTISFLFVLMTFTLAYLVRIAEAPANIEHVYFWNQLWLVVVTATSTGYGDLYPLTHFGRFICILAMMGGILLTALLISTVSSNLELNAGEHKLMNFLQSEHWEQQIKVAATKCIQSWWRRAIYHPRTMQALRNFKAKKKAYRKFLEATPHFGAFVESMKQDTENVRQTLSQIAGKAVSGIDLGKLDKGNPLLALGGGGGGGVALGGNPVPSKLFEELMAELAQIRKANVHLKTMIEKGSITTPAPILSNGYQMGSTTPGRGVGATTPGFTRVGSNSSTTPGRARSNSLLRAPSVRGHGGADSGQNSARSGGYGAGYAGQDPAVIASKAVEERVRRLEIQVNNFDKGMAKCLSQIVRLLQGLY